jgi:preprotein translocase subunit Sec63
MIFKLAPPRRLFSSANKGAVSFDAQIDYYRILGVQKSADVKQIRMGYYTMAKKWHPDLNSNLKGKN